MGVRADLPAPAGARTTGRRGGGEDNTYRQATIFEIQRNRTVIDFAGRDVAAPAYQLGQWTLPQGYSILVSLLQLHRDPNVYPDPERFDPQRFLDEKPNTYSWVPFGGGTRRCVGAAFANMEMDVVLRTVLRHFTIRTTSAPGEMAPPRRRVHPEEGRTHGRLPAGQSSRVSWGAGRVRRADQNGLKYWTGGRVVGSSVGSRGTLPKGVTSCHDRTSMPFCVMTESAKPAVTEVDEVHDRTDRRHGQWSRPESPEVTLVMRIDLL